MNEAPTIGWLRHNFLPPSETFIYASLRGLDAAGIPVHVLALNRRSARKFPDANVTALNDSPGACFGAAAYWLTGRSARERSWSQRVSLVHAHMGYTGAHGLRIARRRKLPLVTSFYGRDVTLAGSPMRFAPQYLPYALWREALMAEGDRFLVLSRHMRRRLLEQGYPGGRIRIVRLGIDIDRFTMLAPRPSTRISTVLMIGREVQKKGFDDGLRACAIARARGAKIRVVLLGTRGPLRSGLQRLARDLQLAVEWPSPKTCVPGLLAQANILLVPSRTADNGDSEGTPTVICEAAAAGLPIVATRHAGIPEQVVDGSTGLLTPERDLDKLASALVTLAADDDMRRALGAAGRRKMLAEYSLEAHTRSLIEIYQELLPSETLVPAGHQWNTTHRAIHDYSSE
ncbi:MAG: glycosyltransferase [Deltaproteobacteria bacterium]|nr:glycosyltransferase [Deltaproteobacteria bacterium]